MASQSNSILAEQNQPPQLDRLAAQRCLYTQAKRVVIWQLAFTVPGAVIVAAIAAFHPSFRAWTAFYGFCVSIIDASVLEWRQKALKQQAAQIQEQFDCKVLQLEWPNWKTSGRPDGELIHEASCQYQKRDTGFSRLKNWYPLAIEGLPLHLARLICQRASLRYDDGLRRRYNGWMIWVIAGLCVMVLALGLIGGLTVEKFVLVVLAPLSPAILWSIREYKRQEEAAVANERLKMLAETMWADALKNEDFCDRAAVESRRLQDEIYERRRSNPLIFDKVYDWLQDSSEAQMNKAASELAEEARIKTM